MAEKVQKPAKQYKHPALISAVKAVAVLVCICFVCVALLAVCNEFLYIDDAERLARAMRKIYPDFENDETFKGVLDTKFTTNPNSSELAGSTVKSVMRSTDGVYVIEALGSGGYDGGSVTLYVVIGADAKIIAWTIKSNDRQSYIGRIPSTAGSSWYVGKDISNDLPLEMTGATVLRTSTAINHAINIAGYYARNALGLGENPEGEARAAIAELLAGTDYADYTLTVYNSASLRCGEQSYVDVINDGTDTTLSYLFLGTSADDAIFVHVFGAKETLQIVVTHDGEVVAKSESVTEESAVYTNITTHALYFYTQTFAGVVDATSTLNVVLIEGEEAGVYYVTATKLAGWEPSDYTLKVTVTDDDGDNKGTATEIELLVNGFAAGYPSEGDANKLVESLVGATLANIDAMYADQGKDGVPGTGYVTHATRSAKLIAACVKTALAHFDAQHASAN